MSDIYKALANAIGYFNIEHSERGYLLIYRDNHNLEDLNVDQLNIADRQDFEITLEIVDNYQDHKSSDGKKGSHKEKVSVDKLGDFTIRSK